MSGGAAYGAGGGIELAWAPGVSLSHQNEASINVTGQYASGWLGGRVSQNVLTYSPDQKKIVPNGLPVPAYVIGGGGGVSVQEEISGPFPGLVWGSPNNPNNTPMPTSDNQTYNYSPNHQVNQTHVPNNNMSTNSSDSNVPPLIHALSSLSNSLSSLSALLSSLTI